MSKPDEMDAIAELWDHGVSVPEVVANAKIIAFIIRHMNKAMVAAMEAESGEAGLALCITVKHEGDHQFTVDGEILGHPIED